MASAHERAVRAANRRVEALGRLFGQLGTAAEPAGAVLSAYRAARAALPDNFSSALAVEDALGTLRLAVERSLSDLLSQAADLGLSQAEQQLAIYGLRAGGRVGAQTSEALRAVLAILEAQIQAVRAAHVMGAEEIALGDEGRVGVLTPGALTAEASKWLALIAEQAYDEIVESSLGQAGAQDEYLRQAVAAIDERTTETCLLVHGQAVELNGDFTLRGTPRFADRLPRPPFHWWCRTAITLVRKRDAEDHLTVEMRDAAKAELTARKETGQRVEIHPASARSRR